MSSSSDSSSCEEVDFNIYRKSYESDEHWQLRKAFMEKHWDNFEEDEIQCLAQVFVNMEFLGCKYPTETMTRVAQLSQEVPEIVRYRIGRRNALKRTFVGAQDAVQAKLTKTGAKRKLGNESQGESSFTLNSTPMGSLGDWTTSEKAQFNMAFNKEQKFNNLRGLLRDVVVFEVPNDVVASRNKTISDIQKRGKLEMKHDKEQKKFLYIFNGQIVGEGSGEVKKEAKKIADEDFWKTLKANCYTITQKLTSYTIKDIITPDLDKTAERDSTKLKEDNLGFKMLKMLGWTGGSLGSKGEGIVDPVSCEIKLGRAGLGANEKLDPKRIRTMLKNFKNSKVEYDLVFSNEFTKEERAQIHMIAEQFSLKTKSFGKNESRHLVISTKRNSLVLRQKLLEGDPHLLEKYEIAAPPPPPKKPRKN